MSIGNSPSSGWFPVAVQALVVLAETDGPCSSSAMAQDLKAHAVYLRRVLAQLVRANLILAREGRDGGYRLARSPEHITLAEVYQAVKAEDQMRDTTSRRGVNERVQSVLEKMGAEAERYLLELLSQQTLASVLERVEITRPSA